MAYRDPRLALEERVRVLTEELEQTRAERDEARRERAILVDRLRRMRRPPFVQRVGRGAIFAALGGAAGLLLSCFPAAATDNIALLVPFTLLGTLFGGLAGLAEDI